MKINANSEYKLWSFFQHLDIKIKEMAIKIHLASRCLHSLDAPLPYTRGNFFPFRLKELTEFPCFHKPGS
jgi:hypothetical protein